MNLSRNKLNKKFKLMVKAPGYVIYSNMPPHTRALWTRSVDATQAFFILGAEYSTLNEGWLRFKPLPLVTSTSNSMSKNQLNQKLKPMISGPKICYIL